MPYFRSSKKKVTRYRSGTKIWIPKRRYGYRRSRYSRRY